MRAFIYFNLHKHLFSVRNTRTGRVEKHAGMAVIRDAQFVVREAGRQRVLREKRKNVHAGVRGELAGCWVQGNLDMRGWTRCSYNPYRGPYFVRVSDGASVEGAQEVRLVLRDGKARIFARGLTMLPVEAQAA